jgi:hypothetical protein
VMGTASEIRNETTTWAVINAAGPALRNHLAEGRFAWDSFVGERERFAQALDAVERLYGTTLRDSLERTAVKGWETVGTLHAAYEAAAFQAAADQERDVKLHLGRVMRQSERIEALVDVLVAAVEAEQARLKRSHREPPAWLAAASELLEPTS